MPDHMEMEGFMMNERLVRDLTPREHGIMASAKTGDTLSDGSILLRRRDMDLMGLEGLRKWIKSKVLDSGGVLTVWDEIPTSHLSLILDD